MSSVSRRMVLKGAALGALAYTVGGAEVLLSPREAHAQGLPLKVLTADERAALEALGETLLPGAKDAGLAHYVDQQLSVDPSESLLLARALGVMPPYADFYRAGLAGLDQSSRKAHGVKFAELAADKRTEFVEQIRQKVPEGWSGPPSPFFYFVSRGDAVDVYFGTVEGFERLGIPYMPHIIPIKRW
ncbi:MAG: gluconate 2-dehydrogenase subunit 3 family protein [Betaproteobacteria bacterium]|nr:MAG: gluconate 2-dehydrogenase subunit 3 family protein [Betaproteobacteria bacterium]